MISSAAVYVSARHTDTALKGRTVKKHTQVHFVWLFFPFSQIFLFCFSSNNRSKTVYTDGKSPNIPSQYPPSGEQEINNLKQQQQHLLCTFYEHLNLLTTQWKKSYSHRYDENVCLSGLKEVIVALSFFLYYEYHQSICFAENCCVSIWEHLQNKRLFGLVCLQACTKTQIDVLNVTEVLFFPCTFAFATALQCSRPFSVHVTRRRKFTDLQRQAVRRAREELLLYFNIMFMLFLRWPLLLVHFFFNRPVQVVKVKVKSSPRPLSHTVTQANRQARYVTSPPPRCTRGQRGKQKVIFLKTKQYIQTWAEGCFLRCCRSLVSFFFFGTEGPVSVKSSIWIQKLIQLGQMGVRRVIPLITPNKQVI